MNPDKPAKRPSEPNRRDFIARSAAIAGTAAAASLIPQSISANTFNPFIRLPEPTLINFSGGDSMFHGHDWQTLNPGYWKIENGALRRRLKNYGDRARRTGFPYHAETHDFEFKTKYDPSLDDGIIYSPKWNLRNSYTIKASLTFRGNRPQPAAADEPDWKMFQDGFGLMGISIGSSSLFESYNRINQVIRIVWADDRKLKILGPPKGKRQAQGGLGGANDVELAATDAAELSPGDQCHLIVSVSPRNARQSTIAVELETGGKTYSLEHAIASNQVNGFTGIVGRGLIDFEVNDFEVVPGDNQPHNVGIADCLTCYPLGDTLKLVDGNWVVRFVGMFGSDGQQVEIRVHDSESPPQGWADVAVAGTGKIVDNDWRRNTAIVDVSLPVNPAEKTLFYTVWKDGVDVTADGRVGTDACGPGTGLVGDVPRSGGYVGRLPQLKAPYKLCGLSCHAINSGLQQRTQTGWKMSGGKDVWHVRDQPTAEAYQHLDDYEFQVMVWEDDVWYMELLLYPPSTDDAYKIVALSICGPTSRWQMMRHWNVMNPGDHDYGMDDVKGPEQIVIRKTEGLGQDPAYMRRNFQIVHHLTTGAEEVDPYENPKKWRSWKMPNRDFTFVVLDSRLWRSSQDVDMWDDQGWNEFKSLYDRTDPTRSLLGEEQFGWLQELLATDSSPLICLTGVNGLHTIWTGAKNGKSASKDHPKNFAQRDRVTADYAGWVKAGSDRVIELLGSRDGVASVYGDVHNGCLMTNVDHRVIECSFGPIGRSGGRGLIPGFGRKMKDVDERDVEVHALYHSNFADPDQSAHGEADPYYWNFLEMEFDPAHPDPKIGMRIRNLVDPPTEAPRGGGVLESTATQTGRVPTCKMPPIITLPNADVFFTESNGKPIRGARSDSSGVVHVAGLVDVSPGAKVVVTAFDGEFSKSQVVLALDV